MQALRFCAIIKKKMRHISMASVRCCGATAGGFLQGSGEKEQFMSMGKILVADDDQNIAELLRLYLEKEG